MAVFEIRDLAYASPATVTRAGALYIPEAGQWKNFVESWIQNREENEPANMSAEIRKGRGDKLRALFDKYLPHTMLEIKKNVSRFSTPLTLLGLRACQPRRCLETIG